MYALVAYDLQVAKVAKQIQSSLAPAYHNVFIMFGGFHIMLSYLSFLGRIIEGSGVPYLMTESGILAEGSLNGFF